MSAEERRSKFYPEEEIVALVQSLDRPQDNHLFSEDVLRQYPRLAEEYQKVCPKRCDLATAARKATSGEYSFDARLLPLREDIALMVNNCLRFNGTTGPLADTANSFHRYANEQIDAYLTRKTGGRRVSSLRLVAVGETVAPNNTRNAKQHTQSTSHNSSTTRGAPAQEERGRKRQREERVEKVESRSATNSAGSGAQSPTPRVITTGELVKLAESLKRREDGEAFVVDVAEAFPDLREAYEQVCPKKMNLTVVRERAENGFYLQPQSQSQSQQKQQQQPSSSHLFGASVADSMVQLRQDVELMVQNCIRFNTNVPSWVRLAQSFQLFAHRRIDEFVLRHAPSLRGTRTGADTYAVFPQPQEEKHEKPAHVTQSQEKQTPSQSPTPRQQLLTQTEEVKPPSRHGLPAHSAAAPSEKREGEKSAPPSATHAYAPTARRETGGRATRRPSAPEVVVVRTVAPSLLPTAMQPPLTLPEALSRRMVDDHLHRDTLRARLIEMAEMAEEKEEKEEEGTSTAAGARRGDTRETFPPALSCRAVLDAFVSAVDEFYTAQLERQDFLNPFEFPRQERQLYADCVILIKQQFERLFLQILLYDQERVDVYERSALKALQKAMKSGGAASPLLWLDEVHLCYLVRFLVHLPQLLGLACATTTTTNVVPNLTTKPPLQITTVAKGIIEKLAKLTEELLSFIARYEEKMGKKEVVEES